MPVVSLIALWGFATVTTAQDLTRLNRLQRTDETVRAPVAAAVTALQAERRAAVRQSAAPGASNAAALAQHTARTDEALARLMLDPTHTVADSSPLPKDTAERLDDFLARTEGLRALRGELKRLKSRDDESSPSRTEQPFRTERPSRAEQPSSTEQQDDDSPQRGGPSPDDTYGQYTAAVTAAFAVTGSLATERGAHARVLVDFGRAAELLSREDALLCAAALTGTLDGQRLRDFTGAVEARRTLIEATAPDLPGQARADWRRLAGQDAQTRLLTAEDKILAAPAGTRAARAVPPARWNTSVAAVRDGMRAIESRAARPSTDPLKEAVLAPSGAAVLLGLAAVLASLVISVSIGRTLVVELVELRNSALEIARRKLPRAMAGLRGGNSLDIDAEAPTGPPAQDEVGQVGEALTTVHRAALTAAAERAELADGVAGVFVNLARRSQVLVHRQLSLLDSMERRTEDPNELGDLFRLDHLTTRMRRHAESLIILSGAAPGRAWRLPVSLTNVVRAAVSEIEDYTRVEVRPLPESALVGTAVADLTHLLAELIENATQFSPPHTKVRVVGEPVGHGYALEVEDRGLGMGEEARAAANHRIAHSDELDLFESDQLGLFVVSRLAARHGVKVQLHPSPYGGTTAVVLIPTGLLQSEPAPTGQHRAPPAATATPPTALAHGTASLKSASPNGAAEDGTALNSIASNGIASNDTASNGTDPNGTAPIAEASDRGTVPPLPPLRAAAPHVPSPRAPYPHGPVPRDPAPRGLVPPDDGPAPDLGDPLPRRVRQASLAPQLRVAPTKQAPAGQTASPGPYAQGGPPARTPEQARDRMTAYRAGWLRGAALAPPPRSADGPGGDADAADEGDRT
ncbi:nitrate- and nitrite sensing domain-containing protein [Streptomyces sp. NPDC050504]|uniref:sensor histidine kinase n=1 Tax=Streptomyces sp. NPDC050504 TaxID=3365618 RepID=UPI0037A87424